jgi:hypothetical protein
MIVVLSSHAVSTGLSYHHITTGSILTVLPLISHINYALSVHFLPTLYLSSSSHSLLVHH